MKEMFSFTRLSKTINSFFCYCVGVGENIERLTLLVVGSWFKEELNLYYTDLVIKLEELAGNNVSSLLIETRRS